MIRTVASGGVSQLARFLAHLPGVAWTADLDSRITWIGGRGLAAAGLVAADIEGRRIDELPGVTPSMSDAHQAALRGEATDYSMRYIERDYLVRVEPVSADDGTVLGSIGYGSDMTEQYELERRLRVREEDFESLMAHAPDIVSRFDAERRFLYVSEAITTATGIPSAFFAGRTNSEIGLPEEQCALWERQLATVFEERRRRQFEFHFDNPAGDTRWFETYLVPELNGAGEVETVVAFARDRTDARRAEQEKLASEARYRELFERAIDMIVVFDLEGSLVDVNPAVERTLGYGRAELIGSAWSSLMVLDEREAAMARMARKRDGSETATVYESLMLSKDGRRVPVEVSTEVILRDGKPSGVLAIVRDVSERIAARVSLEEGERMLRSAFEGTAVGMILADPDGKLLRANAAFAAMLGYLPAELVGVKLGEIVLPEDAAVVVARLSGRDAGLPVSDVVELRFVRADGEICIGHIGLSAVRADDGSIVSIVGQVEDVTELRHVQAELDESHELHRLVVESSRDVLTVSEPDGTLRLVSPSVTGVLGYDVDELVGRNFAAIVHPEDLSLVVSAVEAALRGESTDQFRCRFIDKKGSYHLAEGTVAPGRDADGNPAFLVANTRDVTAQVELEDQLRQSQKMEAVGRLAGGVAHDFNNLLLAIRGYAELALQKNEAHDDSSSEIGEVIDAADRAAGVTRQLLAFSRRQMMNLETLDLRDVIGDMVKLLRRLIGENVELSTVWPDMPTLVRADKAQVEQVIANLAVNATAAMPDGGHLAIEVVQDDDRRQVLLIVRDDGTGMDALTAAQIFEPFFTTKGTDGTGLGLSTVHGIVTQSGGQIEVDSRPGGGTTFTISLPLVDAVDLAPDQVAAPPAPFGGVETILLAEDNSMVTRAVARMLEYHGYRLITVESGEEAIDFARNAPGTIDLLLTDLVMRGLNGRQTAEIVLQHQPQAKVLYMSGYTDDVVIRVGQFEPGTAFIQKPFSGDELARRVRELLDTSTA